MGKIINALRVAQDEVAELVLPQIDDQPDGALDLEPIPPIDHSADPVEAFATLVEPMVEEEPEEHERRLSLCVSEMWPLLSSREDRNAAEQYRLIRTKIIQHSLAPSMIVVSSPGSGDGKTVTAVNLAAALASRNEEHVLLVDADLRRSAIHSYLHAPEAPGLADVLAGTCEFEDAILNIEQVPNLYVLTAGKPVGNPTELLDSSAWLDLTKKLRQDFQRVVVDSPPVGMVADYDVLAAACDGVILVVRPDHTSRKLCMGALKKINEKLIGVLLNATDNWFLWRHYSHEYYLSVRDWKKGVD